MSGKLVGLVFEHFHGDPLSKLVFLALADRADHRHRCWPSRADLCSRSGASPATVGRKLRDLERLGWIQRKQRFHASVVFRINAARLLEFAALAAKVEGLPDGFEPFPEERARAERLAAASAAQVIEKKDDDHSDRQNDHCERKNDHLDDHLTSKNLSKNLSAGPKLAPVGFVADLGKLGRAGADAIRGGRAWFVDGRKIEPSSPEGARLRHLLRARG